MIEVEQRLVAHVLKDGDGKRWRKLKTIPPIPELFEDPLCRKVWKGFVNAENYEAACLTADSSSFWSVNVQEIGSFQFESDLHQLLCDAGARFGPARRDEWLSLFKLAEKSAVSAETLRRGLIDGETLATVDVPPRKNICGTWFREGDLGFVFGERGLGKTWFSLDLAIGLAEGRKVGPWVVPEPKRVCYIDGEMPLDGMRDRQKAFGSVSKNLLLMNHERLFDQSKVTLNLSNPEYQQSILNLCVAESVNVLFIDNLSCLFSGVAENDADAWELVLPWLLDLRRNRISVILIHHANRGGVNMRGTSRREDAAFWVVRLAPPNDGGGESTDGARFISSFTKNRQGTREETEPLQWFYELHKERVYPSFKRLDPIEELLGFIQQGMDSCSELADAMNVSKATVSRLAKRASENGRIKIENKRYIRTDC